MSAKTFRVQSKWQFLSAILFVVFLLSPYFILVGVRDLEPQLPPSTAKILIATFLQAITSSFCALVLGLVYFSALSVSLVRPVRHIVVGLFLLPQFLPVIFLIISVLNWQQLAGVSWTGWMAVVFVHGLLNAPLVGWSLYLRMKSRFGGWIELAWVEGASPALFFLKGVRRPLLGELAILFIFVFALCMTSLSIPMVLGGTNVVSLELSILQSIQNEARLDQAFGLGLIQMAMILGVSMLLLRHQQIPFSREANMQLFSSRIALMLTLLLSTAILLGYLLSLNLGLSVLIWFKGEWRTLLNAARGTLIVSLGVGAFVYLLSDWMIWSWPSTKVRRFLLAYSTPSCVLLGFSLLMIAPSSDPWVQMFKLIVGLSLLLWPLVYRLFLHANLNALSLQYELAWQMGASPYLIYQRVLMPNMKASMMTSAGIAGFWAAGDFAFSSLVLLEPRTLGLLLPSLLSSYRIEIAGWVALLMIILGFIVSIFFRSFENVSHKKP